MSSIKYINICCQSWIIFRYNCESRHRVGITKVPQRRVLLFRDSYLVWFCSGRVGSAARRSPSVALFFFNSFRVCRAQTEFYFYLFRLDLAPDSFLNLCIRRRSWPRGLRIELISFSKPDVMGSNPTIRSVHLRGSVLSRFTSCEVGIPMDHGSVCLRESL